MTNWEPAAPAEEAEANAREYMERYNDQAQAQPPTATPERNQTNQ